MHGAVDSACVAHAAVTVRVCHKCRETLGRSGWERCVGRGQQLLVLCFRRLCYAPWWIVFSWLAVFSFWRCNKAVLPPNPVLPTVDPPHPQDRLEV